MEWFLMLMGAGTLIALILAGVTTGYEFIKDWIYDLRREYQYKHRFDKLPTAKCYCVDCKYHNNETGRCYRFHEKDGRLTADCWFCYEAEPKKEMVDLEG